MYKTRLEAVRFKELLNIFDAAKQQNNSYPGRFPVTDEMLEQHLRGEITLGFIIATERFAGKIVTARFAGIDVDQHFDERLPVFRTVLEKVNLAESCFVTGGSEPGRGKIILSLRDGIDRCKVAELLERILLEAHKLAPDIIPNAVRNGDLELYPRKPKSRTDSSGLLRIAGRNIGKHGPLERLETLSRERLDVFSVSAGVKLTHPAG